jgi:transcription factor 1
VPRVRHEWHQNFVDVAELVKKRRTELQASGSIPEKDSKFNALYKQLKRLQIQLNQDNRRWHSRTVLDGQQAEIDEMERSLARAAADPQTDPQKLRELDSKLVTMRADWKKLHHELDYVVHERADLYIDDRRAAKRTGNIDNAVLLWDRRPFEPMHIEYDELYPIQPCTMVYFEPDRDSPLVKTLEGMERGKEKHDLTDLTEEIISVVGMRNSLSVNEFLNALFPERPINDIVKAVPSLASLASKSLKMDSDTSSEGSNPINLSSTHKERQGEAIDPVYTYQDNINYDLSGVRIRSVPVLVLWDIILEYSKWPAKATSTRRINTILGGSMTDYQAAILSFNFKAGKAGGKVDVL